MNAMTPLWYLYIKKLYYTSNEQRTRRNVRSNKLHDTNRVVRASSESIVFAPNRYNGRTCYLLVYLLLNILNLIPICEEVTDILLNYCYF